MTGYEALLRELYAAFNARDVEAALAGLHPEVDWPNAMEGGREHGSDAVRAYWRRQFEVIDSRVEPLAIAEADDGGVVVDVRQVVRDRSGAVIADQQVQHVYAFRDGLVARMDVRGG